ncbi:MAG: CPBP family intramembrane metalloprotease [Gemmataceae bacterium]|nr:CPBP family intramembrane metalloprotease [Gemmataceae bacterium]
MINWNKIRILFSYNLLDLLRDRRTLFMVVLLPVILYPLLGVMMVQLLASKLVKPMRVGVIGWQQTGVSGPGETLGVALPFFAPAALLPGGFCPGPVQALELLGPHLTISLTPPPLFTVASGQLKPTNAYAPRDASFLLSIWKSVDPAKITFVQGGQLSKESIDALLLEDFDCLIEFPVNLWDSYLAGGAPKVRVFTSQKETMRRVVSRNLRDMLLSWQDQMRLARFLQRSIPGDFHRALQIELDEDRTSAAENIQDRMREPIKDLIPFLVVIWALVGALYPSIDLCAGEKERGTMETLLISAATRLEIVLGKFLAIWLYSITAAVINLVCIGLTVGLLSHWYLNLIPFQPSVAIWGFALLLPTSALFSALGLAIGIYARSTREGQYFLTPLVMVVMPLILLSFGDIKLGFTSDFIPITGLVVLLQNFMTAKSHSGWLVVHLAVVMTITSWYAWLALRYAVRQFQREEVLFREAELIHWPTLMRSFWPQGNLAASPGIGIMGFLLLGLGMHLLTRTSLRLGIDPVVLATIPVLIISWFWMQEGRGILGWKPGAAWGWPLAMAMGLLLIPITGKLLSASAELQGFKEILGRLSKEQFGHSGLPGGWSFLLGSALLPVLCKEMAFRGFLLNNLKTALGPLQAVFLSALLYAAAPLQASRFLPDLVLGLALGLLAVRAGSVWPGMLAHLALVLPGSLAFAFPTWAQGLNLNLEHLQEAEGTWRLLVGFSSGFLAIVCLALAWPNWFSQPWQKLKTEIQSSSQGD